MTISKYRVERNYKKPKTKLEKIKDLFYWLIDNRPDLDNYGVYRIGLTYDEIDNYLIARAKTLKIKEIKKKFWDIAGINTMGVSPYGESLMFRHDVQRFADDLFLGEDTYFD